MFLTNFEIQKQKLLQVSECFVGLMLFREDKFSAYWSKTRVLPSTGYTFLANCLPKNSSFLAVACFIRSVYHYFLIFSRFADTGGYRETPLQEL